MEAHIIDPASPRWHEALAAGDHDFYHLPEYVALEARRVGGRPVAALAREGDGGVFLPLVLQPLPEPLRTGAELDATSPYGYPCPLLLGRAAHDPALARRALEAAMGALAEHHVVAAFVRGHPLLPVAPEILDALGHRVEHGETVWMDTTLQPEEMWRQTRASDRNRLNKLRRMGVTARMDPAFEHLAEFVEIYRETMGHVNAADWYFFDVDYFRGLKRALGDALHLCLVETAEGEIIAAGLFSEVCKTVQYHLSGTRSAFRKLSPTRTMLDFVRTWAHERGAERFHLGGGLGAAKDALFEFKAGFSPLRAQFYTWRVVLDAVGYRRTTTAWEEAAGRAAESANGFFPAYRKPLPDRVAA